MQQINNKFDLMHAFKIGHLRRISSLDKRLKPGLYKGRQSSAQNDLFAKEVCLCLFPEDVSIMPALPPPFAEA